MVEKSACNLNGEREISGEVDPTSGDELFVGGQADSSNSFEGKIDEVVAYRRALKQGRNCAAI